MAILLAAARVLTEVRAQLPGSVRLLFQPAEEGAPAGESPAGADAMVQAGLLKDPKVDAIFGLHVIAPLEAGILFYRAGPMMAAADRFEIVVEGRQTHGSTPWRGVDPIVVGAQIVAALQTVVSRQVDITQEPAVVSVGQFEAGVRNNIIPDRARLVGTIRTFDTGMQADIHERVRKTAEGIAAAAGATVKVTVARGYPPVDNDVALTERMRPTLERTAPGRVRESRKITGAEDFSFFQREAPGMYLFLGITPPAQLETAASNHAPRFFVEESALSTGLRALVHLTADYLAGAPAARH
jgi:amidohydrolase